MEIPQFTFSHGNDYNMHIIQYTREMENRFLLGKNYHILVVFRTTTGAMGLCMRHVNRLYRACAVFYRQLSDISVAVRH